MTFLEKVIMDLVANGVSPAEARIIADRVIESPEVASMKNRWDEDIEVGGLMNIQGYKIIWAFTKEITKQWIEETCPTAWYRGLFN